jgi:threonine/homoserine/homoserine lactone efflux protein
MKEITHTFDKRNVVKSFIIGFSIGFIGLLPPGMLNMSSLRVSLENGLKEAIKFSIGASLVVGIHSFIAFTFSNYLQQHPEIIARLKWLGIFVFFILSILFFRKSRQKQNLRGKESKGNMIRNGFLLSNMNMLGIPFYLGASIALGTKTPEILTGIGKTFLVSGAMFGAFTLFSCYSIFAKLIKTRISYIAENINLILSILFFILFITVGYATIYSNLD